MPGRAKNTPESRWQRMLRSLLYGRNVDREVKARARLGLAIVAFAAVYGVIAFRLVMFAMASTGHGGHRTVTQDALATARPDIIDRNGAIIATDVKAPSLYAEPRKLIDIDDAEEQLTAELPDLDGKELRERLASKRGFVWLKREITPKQQQEIYRLGIPGVGFLTENKRVYPNGATVSQVIGLVNIDNQGIAGMEKWLDGQGLAALHMAGLATDRLQRPVQLSLDLRAQYAMRDELLKAREKFNAKAAAGLILNVNTGEVVALVSDPDYNPNNPREANDPSRINRMTTGVFEMGSTFKVLTVAMALDSGKATMASSFDARHPLQYGKFAIHDYEPKGRFLTVPEIFTFSSNIGAARMALAVGVEGHQAFLKKMGQLDRLRTELPESAEPLVPKHWGELNTVTIAFGHGLSVAPLQAIIEVAALVHAGLLIPPTFLKRPQAETRDQRNDALFDAPERRARHGPQGGRPGLLYRRQDRYGRQGGQRSLFESERAHRLHGDSAGRPAALSPLDHAGRSESAAGDARFQDLGLECGAGRRRGRGAHRPAARHHAAFGFTGCRSPDTGLDQGKQVRQRRVS